MRWIDHVLSLLRWKRFIAINTLIVAVGSVVGGQAGARIGRRIPPTLLRVVIVTVGLLVVFRYVTR